MSATCEQKTDVISVVFSELLTGQIRMKLITPKERTCSAT